MTERCFLKHDCSFYLWSVSWCSHDSGTRLWVGNCVDLVVWCHILGGSGDGDHRLGVRVGGGRSNGGKGGGGWLFERLRLHFVAYFWISKYQNNQRSFRKPNVLTKNFMLINKLSWVIVCAAKQCFWKSDTDSAKPHFFYTKTQKKKENWLQSWWNPPTSLKKGFKFSDIY